MELSQDEQVSIDSIVRVIEVHGPDLALFSGRIAGSRYPQLRQLRIPHDGRLLCVRCLCEDLRATLVLLSGTRSTAADACAAEPAAHADAEYESYLAVMNRGPH